MSAGHMKPKSRRTEAWAEIQKLIKEANKRAQRLKHPDNDPREVSAIYGLLIVANGDYYDSADSDGLDDLSEHYFS